MWELGECIFLDFGFVVERLILLTGVSQSFPSVFLKFFFFYDRDLISSKLSLKLM